MLAMLAELSLRSTGKRHIVRCAVGERFTWVRLVMAPRLQLPRMPRS